ncbi:MAG TPA: hypothetical protein VFB66_30885 [Tepidisphaeraceae bacterium]|nr:hypothetical protein [Tepidisphaeraceae bacterium]
MDKPTLEYARPRGYRHEPDPSNVGMPLMMNMLFAAIGFLFALASFHSGRRDDPEGLAVATLMAPFQLLWVGICVTIVVRDRPQPRTTRAKLLLLTTAPLGFVLPYAAWVAGIAL